MTALSQADVHDVPSPQQKRVSCPPWAACFSLFLAAEPGSWQQHIPAPFLLIASFIVTVAAVVGIIKHWTTLITFVRTQIFCRLLAILPGAIKGTIADQSDKFSKQLLEKPAHSTAKFTLFIRIVFLVGMTCQHLLHFVSEKLHAPKEAALWHASPWNLTIFFSVWLIFLAVLVLNSAQSFEAAEIIDNTRLPLQDRNASRTKLFQIALLDVVTIFVAGLWPATVSGDVHLGYFIAALAAWQFPRIRHVLSLFLVIELALVGRWMAVGFFHEDQFLSWITGAEYSVDYPWHGALMEVLARAVFWGFLGLLCLVLLYTRLASEERHRIAVRNETWFRGLADALPLQVFIKNRDKQFLYANESVLALLRTLPQNKDLTCVRPPEKPGPNDIYGKTDLELGIHPAIAKIYEEADATILDKEETIYRTLDPDFRLTDEQIKGEHTKVLTTKVPLKDRAGDCIGLVGFCEEPYTQEQSHIYKAIVECSPHYFFQKDAEGRFKWANEQFWRSAGISNPKERGEVFDKDLYSPKLAEAYRKADEELIAEAIAMSRNERETHRKEGEELHQFKGKREEKVWVIKKPLLDKDGNVTGVQGCFYEIENYVARRALMERAVRDLFPAIHQEIIKALGPVITLNDRSVRKLNGSNGAHPDGGPATMQMVTVRVGPKRRRYLRSLFYYSQNLTRAVRLVNLSRWQLAEINTWAPELAWTPEESFDPGILERLGQTIKKWPKYKIFNFSVRLRKGEEESVRNARVDSGWVYAVAAVYWINAAQALLKTGKFDDWKPSNTPETLTLDLSMKGEALVIAVANHAGDLAEEIKHPEMISRPRLDDDRSMGIGLEMVCRIETISNGKASCQRLPGKNRGAIFSFECPVEDSVPQAPGPIGTRDR